MSVDEMLTDDDRKELRRIQSFLLGVTDQVRKPRYGAKRQMVISSCATMGHMINLMMKIKSGGLMRWHRDFWDSDGERCIKDELGADYQSVAYIKEGPWGRGEDLVVEFRMKDTTPREDDWIVTTVPMDSLRELIAKHDEGR